MTNTAMQRDAVHIREQMRDSEARADELLLGTAELMKRMITARRNPEVVPHAGQAALVRLASAQRKLICGATDLFRVHGDLSKLALETGVMDEDGTTPSLTAEIVEAERALRA